MATVNDTPREVQRIHARLLRQAGPFRRAILASALTNSALARARRGIAAAHPEMSELERRLLFVEVHYGRDLARRVRARMEGGAGGRAADDRKPP
jgi:hypothetical protein